MFPSPGLSNPGIKPALVPPGKPTYMDIPDEHRIFRFWGFWSTNERCRYGLKELISLHFKFRLNQWFI